MEVPLLVESGMQDMFDQVVLVKSDTAERLKRAIIRDNSTSEIIKGIIALQTTDVQREQIANYVINNNGNIENLFAQADELLKIINIYCNRLTK